MRPTSSDDNALLILVGNRLQCQGQVAELVLRKIPCNLRH